MPRTKHITLILYVACMVAKFKVCLWCHHQFNLRTDFWTMLQIITNRFTQNHSNRVFHVIVVERERSRQFCISFFFKPSVNIEWLNKTIKIKFLWVCTVIDLKCLVLFGIYLWVFLRLEKWENILFIKFHETLRLKCEIKMWTRKFEMEIRFSLGFSCSL